MDPKVPPLPELGGSSTLFGIEDERLGYSLSIAEESQAHREKSSNPDLD